MLHYRFDLRIANAAISMKHTLYKENTCVINFKSARNPSLGSTIQDDHELGISSTFFLHETISLVSYYMGSFIYFCAANTVDIGGL